MGSVEKNKKRKPKKNKKAKVEAQAKEESSDVLERVMDSIEMAGASLNFFDEDPAQTDQDTVDTALSGEIVGEDVQELDDALEAADAVAEEEVVVSEPVEPSGEMLEAADVDDSQEVVIEDDTENLSLIEEEQEGIEFVDQTQALSIIESLLFSSERPLGLGTFKQVFKGTNYKTKEIKKALAQMESVYAEAARGVTLEEVNGGWQLRTKVDNMDFLRKLAKARPFKLSGPALEVLAIIAYKQPLVKSEVDQIRGVESGHLVRALMEKHLVCFQGKSELPGKPMQYGTTKKFLEIFGLRNLKELPSLDEIDQLLPDGIGMEEEDEKLSDVTASMSEDYDGNYSESEEELTKIADTLGSIDTSSEFFEQEKIRQKEKRERDRAQDIREAMDVGEDVDTKDQRWLARYDEKMAAIAAEDEEAVTQPESEETMSEETVQLMDQEGLGEEPLEEAELTAATLEETLNEEVSIGDELSMLTQESVAPEEEPKVTVEPLAMAASEDSETAEIEENALDDFLSEDTEESMTSEDDEIDPFADKFE